MIIFEKDECGNGRKFAVVHSSNFQETINVSKKDNFLSRMALMTNAGGRITPASAEEIYLYVKYHASIGKKFVIGIVNHTWTGSRKKELALHEVVESNDKTLFCAVRPSVREVIFGIQGDIEYLKEYIKKKPNGEGLLAYLLIFPVIRDNTIEETASSKAYRTFIFEPNSVQLPVLTHSQKTNLYRFDLVVNCIDWRSCLWIADYKTNAPKHEEVAVAIGPYKSRMWDKEGCDHEIYLPAYAAQKMGILTFAIPSNSKSSDLEPIGHLIDDVIAPKIAEYLVDKSSVIVPIYILGNQEEQLSYLKILKPHLTHLKSKYEIISVQYKIEFEMRGNVDRILVI